jgi:3-oxoacyl-[acyl-carrier protein] reductase
MNVVRLSRLVLPGMRGRRWGRILNLTSLAAKQPDPMLTISSTLRAGISALTKSLSLECARDGVTVNALLPGNIMTDRQVHLAEQRAMASGGTVDEQLSRTAASIPMSRLGRPEDIGDAAAFLCGERASYITGVSLQVDGGIISSTF